MNTASEWATEALTIKTDDFASAKSEMTLLVRRIEDAALDRAATIAEQDPENRGKIATAIRAMRHCGLGRSHT